MDVPKILMCLMLLFAAVRAEAKDVQPDQQSIDSLLRAIDEITVNNYVDALRFIDSTLVSTKDNPTFAKQYLYVKMKKSNVLLKAKAYSKAFQNLVEIEATINNQPDELLKAFYQAMLAFIYGDQGNLTMAIQCYKRALESYENTQQFRKMAITRNNLADSYLAIGDYEQALREINQALALHAVHQFNNIAVIFSTAGEIELSMKNYNKALSYFNQAVAMSDSLKSNYAAFNPERNLFMAKALIGLKEFSEAKVRIDACKSKLNNDAGLSFKYYLTLIDYFSATHKFDSALVYHEKALALSQRIDAQESAEAIEMVRLNERYENENLLLRQQIEVKLVEQKLYILMALLSVLSVAFLVYVMAVKRRDFKRLKIQHEEIAAQSEELKALTDKLAAQGEVLQQANEMLEAKVNERTTTLRAKNEQLTQYAFFNAHKLRSPIATLLGLKQLLRLSASPLEKDEILEKIFTTTESFDEVVRESQKILEDFDGEEIL